MALFHSFSWLNNIPLYLCSISLFTPVDGHLGCFCILAIVNNAAVDVGVHVFFFQVMVLYVQEWDCWIIL